MRDSSITTESAELQFLQQYLAGRDAECPQCQYNLRGLLTNRCPECGEQLVVRVNVAEPKQGLLIAGLTGLAAGGGLNGLLLIYMLIQVMRWQTGNYMEKFALINGTGFVIEGIALWIWLRKWRQIRRRPTHIRVLLMLACWALTILDLLVFSFTIR